MKLNNIWGYGQLFGYSAYEGVNRYQDDHILMSMKQPLSFRYEFLYNPVLMKFIRKEDKVDIDVFMSDFLVAKINNKDFALAFLDNDTLVGKSIRLPSFTSDAKLDKKEYKNKSIINVDNHYLTLVYKKEKDNYRFLIHHSLNSVEANKDYLKVLNKADLSTLIAHYTEYYQKMPKCRDMRYEALFYKCLSVNKVNTHTPEGRIAYFWTTPDRVPHRHMWLWDSGFHALMMSDFNAKAAEDSLIAMLTQMREDGFLPHMANPNARSYVTQPCILSWVAYNLYAKSHNLEFLKKCAPYLEHYLNFDINKRDENHNGLLEWYTEPEYEECKCGESGLDNSPRFDFDEKMDCIDFSCYLALDSKYLSLIYKALGDEKKSKQWLDVHKHVSNQINALMWDKDDHVYYDRLMSNKLTKVLTPSSFFPMWVGIVSKERAKEMVKVITDKKLLYSPAPLSSISQLDKRFSNDMWRGGVWINVNYFIIQGLKNYGYTDLAKELRDKTLEMVNKWYLKHGCVFEFYDPTNEVSPFMCKRKGPALKEPDWRKHVHSISDYHWSAALSYLLIQNEY